MDLTQEEREEVLNISQALSLLSSSESEFESSLPSISSRDESTATIDLEDKVRSSRYMFVQFNTHIHLDFLEFYGITYSLLSSNFKID